MLPGATLSSAAVMEALSALREFPITTLFPSHPFGTIKRGFGITYFLTKGLESVKTETYLAFLAYNMKRAVNILGVREVIRRLTGKNIPATSNYINSLYYMINLEIIS